MIGLPTTSVQATCKNGQGENQCRFLGRITKTPAIFVCLKNDPVFRKAVDDEASAFATQFRNTKSANPGGVPLGDNCNGYLRGMIPLTSFGG